MLGQKSGALEIIDCIDFNAISPLQTHVLTAINEFIVCPIPYIYVGGQTIKINIVNDLCLQCFYAVG